LIGLMAAIAIGLLGSLYFFFAASQSRIADVSSLGTITPSGVVTFAGDDVPAELERLSPGVNGSGVRRGYMKSLRRSATFTFASVDSAVGVLSLQARQKLRLATDGKFSPAERQYIEQRFAIALEEVVRWVCVRDADRYLQWRKSVPLDIQLDDRFSDDPAMVRLARRTGLADRTVDSYSTFIRAWAKQENERLSDTLVNGVATSEGSFEVHVMRLTSKEQNPAGFEDKMNGADLSFWIGQLGQGCYFVSDSPPQNFDLIDRDGQAIVAILYLVVRTEGRDAHPIHIRLIYDPKVRDWRVCDFSRRSSIRLASPMVF